MVTLSAHTRRGETAIRYSLIWLELLIGIGATYGAVMLVTDARHPPGRDLGRPRARPVRRRDRADDRRRDRGLLGPAARGSSLAGRRPAASRLDRGATAGDRSADVAAAGHGHRRPSHHHARLALALARQRCSALAPPLTGARHARPRTLPTAVQRPANG